MVDPNEVLPLESQNGSSSSFLHDPSASSANSFSVDRRESVPETAYNRYPTDIAHLSGCMLRTSPNGNVPDTAYDAHSSTDMLGAIPKIYSPNLQEGKPIYPLDSALEGVMAKTP
ncbi:hypothetical protein OTU49_000331, partial [Cherax quadricarinatus]